MRLATPIQVPVLLAMLSGLVACETQRTITVTSNPPGALVFLNDEEVGRTPITVPFTFYGTYSVRLEKPGYDPLWTKKEAAAPFWELPGPDLIALLIPGKKVDLSWHYELQALPLAEGVSAIDEQQLLQRADQMRQSLGPAGPRAPQAPASHEDVSADPAAVFPEPWTR